MQVYVPLIDRSKLKLFRRKRAVAAVPDSGVVAVPAGQACLDKQKSFLLPHSGLSKHHPRLWHYKDVNLAAYGLGLKGAFYVTCEAINLPCYSF
jgi:hypothetical protein